MGSGPDDFVPQLMSYRSVDPDAIERFWAEQVRASVSFDRTLRDPAPFRFQAALLGPVTVGRHQPHTDFRIRDEDGDYYLFASARRGYTAVERDGHLYATGTARGVLHRPGLGAPTVRSGGGSRISWIRTEPWVLERHLESLIGRPVPGPIRFRPHVDVGAPAGTSWLSLFEHLVGQVERPDSLLYQPIVAPRLLDSVLTGLLLCTDHPYREVLAAPGGAWSPRGVRRVVDAIQAHPEYPYTATSMARMAGTSVRTLQEGFRAHVGMPPMAYLRQVRLARAHDDLRNSAASSVAEVAHRWGFTHLGRFAAAYATRYGSLPSSTMRPG